MTLAKGDIALVHPDAAAAAMWFASSRQEKGRIVLTAGQDVPAGARLRALVAGITIGTAVVPGRPGSRPGLRAGATLDLACDHYPGLPLPAEIRFARDDSDEDTAPPLMLARPDQVLALVGPGQLEQVQLTLVDGVLRGLAVNPVNALIRPHLICRVNGTLLRDVTVDSIANRPGRGAMITFSVRAEMTDFSASGASYEILSLPDLAVVTSLALTPPLPGDGQSRRMATIETELAQISRRITMEAEGARATLERHVGEQQALLTGFADYMLALIYDRLNPGAALPPDAGVEADPALAAFRQMLAGPGDRAAPPPASVVHLPTETLLRHGGWYPAEIAENGDSFSWMSNLAEFRNPHPDTPVTLMSMQVLGHLSPEVFPITALFDGEAARVEVISDIQGNPLRLNLHPAQGRAKPVHLVQLIAARALSPRDLGGAEDDRLLSVAVAGVAVHFGEKGRA
jgi:hypothetical protein